MLPVAVDAMGGDKAPDEIVAGAHRAVEELGVPVVLVGQPDVLAARRRPRVMPASEVIAMNADPGSSVRRMKDSSLVRAAEAVRDGKASAMVSAGNTGATMAQRCCAWAASRACARPAIATPIPVPGQQPNVLLDAGANAECQADWLCSSPRWAPCSPRTRYGIAQPRVGLLSIGEEASKGTPLVKETHALLDGAEALEPAASTSSATSRAATS